MPRTTTVAKFVELNRGYDFQSGWRGPLLNAIELGQIIAITDLRDDLTGFIAFLVNEVQTNVVDWLMVVGFCHDCLTPFVETQWLTGERGPRQFPLPFQFTASVLLRQK